MGVLKSLGDFLFGKDPDIFDENGKVRHKLPEEKWARWDQRLRANPDYDWQKHTGANLGRREDNKSQSKPK